MMQDRRDGRAEALAAIRAVDNQWALPEQPLHLGEIRWLPDLIHSDGHVLHAFFDYLDAPWRRRLQAAQLSGRKTAVACPPEALTLETLEFLQDVDAAVVVLDVDAAGGLAVKAFATVAHLVALYELSLGRDGLARLGEALFERALAATSNDEKGRLFEQVLLLLFSQVSYFVVLESRYINATEEIDIVLGNRGSGPVGGIIGGPLVVVSAKNRADPIGAPEVRALWGNMTKRRGRCSLGILCAARQLASTAATERTSATTDPTLAVALLDGERIRTLLNSAELDADLERLIRAAVLD